MASLCDARGFYFLFEYVDRQTKINQAWKESSDFCNGDTEEELHVCTHTYVVIDVLCTHVVGE